jgi:hypothetical protein
MSFAREYAAKVIDLELVWLTLEDTFNPKARTPPLGAAFASILNRSGGLGDGLVRHESHSSASHSGITLP